MKFEKSRKKIVEEIIAKNSPDLTKNLALQAQQNPSQIKWKNTKIHQTQTAENQNQMKNIRKNKSCTGK